MPAIKVTGAKGLHQVTATTDLPAGSISGHKKRVKTGFGQADQVLTAEDSGTLFILGTHDTARQICLPAASGSLAGWSVEFALSGSTGVDNALTVAKAGGCTTVTKSYLTQIAGGAAGDITISSNSLVFGTSHDAQGAPVKVTCVSDSGAGGTIVFAVTGVIND